MFKKKWWLFAALLLVCTIIAYFVFGKKATGPSAVAKVKKENFRDVVVSPGELMAENTVYIQSPPLQTHQIYEEIKIQDMVTEGITVKEGDYIATLDPAVVNKKIGDVQLELDRSITTLSQTALDTTLQMRESRDNITNLKFQMEQKKIALELSKFERSEER